MNRERNTPQTVLLSLVVATQVKGDSGEQSSFGETEKESNGEELVVVRDESSDKRARGKRRSGSPSSKLTNGI